MAEIENEKRTFKWGDREYLLDDLLAAHAKYELSFYNFAQDEGSYDNNALAGLKTAITNRINAAKEGRAFQGDGTLDDDVVDNTSIQTLKKGLFKKEKYVEQDNTEWAKHYLNRLVADLKPHQRNETKDKGVWDITKHGLEAYLTGQGLDAREIFEKYDLLDENNPNAPRSFAARHELLRNHLNGYKDWLSGKGFDFTKNDNEWDDNFITSLESLINSTDWNDSIKLASSLRKLGAGDRYTTAFTSDKWDLSKTNEELKVERDTNKKKKDAEQEAAHLKEWEDYAYSARRPSAPVYNRPVLFGENYRDFEHWYRDLNAEQQKEYGTYLGKDEVAWNNAWNRYAASLRGGAKYDDANVSVLLQGAFFNQPHLFLDLGNGLYLIRDSVTDDGQGTVYDPKSGYTDSVFLGDIASSNDEIKKIYRQLAYKWLNNKYKTSYSDRSYVFLEGGQMIPKHLYGSLVAFNWLTTDDVVKPKAKENGNSVKVQKAKDQYLDSDNKSIDNPNAGWDAKHYARLGSAVADLGAAVAGFVPGYGTAASAVLGVGSTVTNFFTDMSDDAVTAGEMWKNLGLNLGMDILGLIPGGGAASKMGKIVKTLKGTVPLIIALPGVASMLANSPEIAASWKKAFDGDSVDGDGSKMNYQDYMNILLVLNVAAGATNIARNTYKSAKASTKQTKKIAVDVTDRAGNKKALVLEGTDVDNFKAANREGKALEFIDKMEGAHEYKINEILKGNKGKFWGKDDNGEFHLFNQNPFGTQGTGRARIYAMRQEAPRVEVVNGKKIKIAGHEYAQTGKWEADLFGRDLVRTKKRARFDDWHKQQQEALDADFAAWRKKASLHKHTTDKAIAARDKITADIDAAMLRKTAADLDIQTQQLLIDNANNRIQKILDWVNNGGVARNQNIIDSAKMEIAQLKAQNAVSVINDAQRVANNQRIAELNKIIEDAKVEMDLHSSVALKAAMDDLAEGMKKQSDLQLETSKLQALLDRLNRHKTYVEARAAKPNSDAYTRIKDFKAIKKKFNDKEYTFDVDESLKKLDGLYKQGGSINRNKISKFLNYGKG